MNRDKGDERDGKKEKGFSYPLYPLHPCRILRV
jgi:hypothetical protein